MITTLSTDTKGRIAAKLLEIEASISRFEETVEHDQLPLEYDELIRQRDAARQLLQIQSPGA